MTQGKIAKELSKDWALGDSTYEGCSWEHPLVNMNSEVNIWKEEQDYFLSSRTDWVVFKQQ